MYSLLHLLHQLQVRFLCNITQILSSEINDNLSLPWNGPCFIMFPNSEEWKCTPLHIMTINFCAVKYDVEVNQKMGSGFHHHSAAKKDKCGKTVKINKIKITLDRLIFIESSVYNMSIFARYLARKQLF